MAKDDSGTSVENKVLAKWAIGDNLTYAELGGVTDTRMSGVYKSRSSIRANRVGYTLLSAVSYNTHQQKAAFCLPLPESLSIPSDFSWSEEAEDGLADFVSRSMENEGQQKGYGEAANESVARYAVGAAKDIGAVKAMMRHTGVAYNPNNQMYFQGVAFSNLPFTFKLVPKSKSEASVMYETAKCIIRLTHPGSAGDGMLELLGKVVQAGQSFIGMQGGTEGGQDPIKMAEQQAAEQQKAAEQMKQAGIRYEQKAAGYLSGAQPAFFTYPPLWDISMFIPCSESPTGYKRFFEWRRLACETARIEFGTDFKWHEDGLPVSLSLTIQLKETILKTASSMYDVMPVIIS